MATEEKESIREAEILPLPLKTENGGVAALSLKSSDEGVSPLPLDEPGCLYRLPMFVYSESFPSLKSKEGERSTMENYSLKSGFLDKTRLAAKPNLESQPQISGANLKSQPQLTGANFESQPNEADLINRIILNSFMGTQGTFRDQSMGQAPRNSFRNQFVDQAHGTSCSEHVISSQPLETPEYSFRCQQETNQTVEKLFKDQMINNRPIGTSDFRSKDPAMGCNQKKPFSVQGTHLTLGGSFMSKSTNPSNFSLNNSFGDQKVHQLPGHIKHISRNQMTSPLDDSLMALEGDLPLGYALIDQLSAMNESFEDKEVDPGRGVFSWSKDETEDDVEKERLKSIAQQVEFYFSDGNICNDRFLQKHLKRNKAGYVSLKLVSSFKRVRNLTKEWATVAQAIDQFSTTLEINDDMTKVRRLQELPTYGASAPSRTVLATNLPLTRPTLQGVTNMFKEFGDIVSVRILRPSNPVPLDLKNIVINHPQLAQMECATIEFVTRESAEAAVKQINSQIRNKMKTTTIIQLAETTTQNNAATTSAEVSTVSRWKNSKLFSRKVPLTAKYEARELNSTSHAI